MVSPYYVAMKTIPFSYPRRGLDGTFATFRLGSSWVSKLTPGETVELIDSRSKRTLGSATVIAVKTGDLSAMANRFGRWAHNWKTHPASERPTLLLASIRQRFKHYGPERTSDTALCSVIILKVEANECATSHQQGGEAP